MSNVGRSAAHAAVTEHNMMVADLEEAQAAIQRVRELHKPVPGFNGHQWCDAQCEATCDGDATEWPCATIRALDGDALEGRVDD